MKHHKKKMLWWDVVCECILKIRNNKVLAFNKCGDNKWHNFDATDWENMGMFDSDVELTYVVPLI
jgi:hypothetical protein